MNDFKEHRPGPAQRPHQSNGAATNNKSVAELLTIPNFCYQYSTGRTTTYALIKANELVAVKIGRSTRITAESAAAWYTRLVAKATGGNQ